MQVLTSIARWEPNGHSGGCHLQDIMQKVEQPSTGNQAHVGLMTSLGNQGRESSGHSWTMTYTQIFLESTEESSSEEPNALEKTPAQFMPFWKLSGKFHFLVRFCTNNWNRTYETNSSVNISWAVKYPLQLPMQFWINNYIVSWIYSPFGSCRKWSQETISHILKLANSDEASKTGTFVVSGHSIFKEKQEVKSIKDNLCRFSCSFKL